MLAELVAVVLNKSLRSEGSKLYLRHSAFYTWNLMSSQIFGITECEAKNVWLGTDILPSS